MLRAEVVIYDHLVHPRLLDLAPGSAERIFVGKTAGHYALKQEGINALLVEKAREGWRVVRLKGGDPYVFGRGAEEAEILAAAGIAYRVIPGVTAGVGVTAYAGLPITHREAASAVAFVTGHDEPGSPASRIDWPSLARFPGTLVVYMGVSRLRSLCETLIREGKPEATPAAIVQSGTLAAQKTVVGNLGNLADLVAEAGLGPPGAFRRGRSRQPSPQLAMVRGVTAFRPANRGHPPERRRGRRGFVAGSPWRRGLARATVQILPLDDFRELDHAIDRLESFDWLVFTSSNGVRHFFDRLETLGKDLRAVGHLRFATIGPATAEALANYRLKADLIPDSYRSEALAEALASRARGKRILLARADRGRTILKEELGRVAEVEQVAVYRNVDAETLPPHVLLRIVEGSVDWVTLTSSAITSRLCELLPEEAKSRMGKEIRLVSISPITTEAASRVGWRVQAQAEIYTWDGVVRAIVNETRGKSQPLATE